MHGAPGGPGQVGMAAERAVDSAVIAAQLYAIAHEVSELVSE